MLASAPQIKQITASAGEKQRLTGALLPAAPAVAAPDTGELFQPVATEAAVLPDGPASAVELTAVNPPANLIPRTQPETVHATAALAFSGVADSELDETALATIEFFMAAGDASSRAIQSRDALQGLLASVPCARLQAEFNPDTGSIDLHGHVPDAGLRTPLIEALKAQIGAGITINDAMLILPRPQCGALSGIATVGLPQSTDQFTNRRLLGADTQTRSYDYGSGAQLVLDLAAPDYDAFIYVDFFDADGQVIHLAPNDRVPLRLRKAGSTVQVGTEAAGEPYLDITIGPPYGQEIAAAFAASRRLYDGVRPMREPAVEYLDWLGQQVTRVRAQDPGFKGEWVYFFISTHE